jgi:hypothetical protein
MSLIQCHVPVGWLSDLLAKTIWDARELEDFIALLTILPPIKPRSRWRQPESTGHRLRNAESACSGNFSSSAIQYSGNAFPQWLPPISSESPNRPDVTYPNARIKDSHGLLNSHRRFSNSFASAAAIENRLIDLPASKLYAQSPGPLPRDRLLTKPKPGC